MPRGATQDVAHEQVTDHRIQIPNAVTLQGIGDREHANELIAVRGIADPRDLGMAFSQLAAHGDHKAGDQAMRLLRQAEHDLNTAPLASSDSELHTQLGFLDQLSGDTSDAAKEYQMAMTANPYDATAIGNTALIDARAGDWSSAARLWSTVFEHDPAQSAAAFNLASAECALGDKEGALHVLSRLLMFSPDNQHAREFAKAINDGSRPCQRP